MTHNKPWPDIPNGSDTPPGGRWAALDEYRILSFHWTVRSTHAGFAESMRWVQSPFRCERELGDSEALKVQLFESGERDKQPIYSYVFDGRLRDRKSERGMSQLLDLAIWDIQAAIPKTVQDFLLVHAAAVGRDASAVLLPARGGLGKSSLTLALLQLGFKYLSDEFGAIDPASGRVHPVEKHITMSPGALRRFPGLEALLQDRKTPVQLGSQRFIRTQDIDASIEGPADVATIVFLTDSREGPPRLSPVPSAESVRTLAANCFNLVRSPEQGLVLLSRVVGAARSFRLEGGTPAERADLLANRLA